MTSTRPKKQRIVSFGVCLLLLASLSSCVRQKAPVTSEPLPPSSPSSEDPTGEVAALSLGMQGPQVLIDPTTYQLYYVVATEALGSSQVAKIILAQSAHDFAEVEACGGHQCQTFRVNTREAFLPLTKGSHRFKVRACFDYGATKSGTIECGPWSEEGPEYLQSEAIAPDLHELLAVLLQANVSLQQEGEQTYDAVASFAAQLSQCQGVDQAFMAQVDALRSVTAAQYAGALSLAPFALPEGLALAGLVNSGKEVFSALAMEMAKIIKLQAAAGYFQALYQKTKLPAFLHLSFYLDTVRSLGYADFSGLVAADKLQRWGEELQGLQTLRQAGRKYHMLEGQLVAHPQSVKHQFQLEEVKKIYATMLESRMVAIESKVAKGWILNPDDLAQIQRLARDLPGLTKRDRVELTKNLEDAISLSSRNATELKLKEAEIKVGASGGFISRREARSLQAEIKNHGLPLKELERVDRLFEQGKVNRLAVGQGSPAAEVSSLGNARTWLGGKLSEVEMVVLRQVKTAGLLYSQTVEAVGSLSQRVLASAQSSLQGPLQLLLQWPLQQPLRQGAPLALPSPRAYVPLAQALAVEPRNFLESAINEESFAGIASKQNLDLSGERSLSGLAKPVGDLQLKQIAYGTAGVVLAGGLIGLLIYNGVNAYGLTSSCQAEVGARFKEDINLINHRGDEWRRLRNGIITVLAASGYFNE